MIPFTVVKSLDVTLLNHHVSWFNPNFMILQDLHPIIHSIVFVLHQPISYDTSRLAANWDPN